MSPCCDGAVADAFHVWQALLAAEYTGDTWQEQGLQQAPHLLDTDGSVKVPQAWKATLKQTYRENPDIIKIVAGSDSPARKPPQAPRSLRPLLQQ